MPGTKLIRSTITTIVAIGFLAFASAGVAQETSVEGYAGVGGETVSGVAAGDGAGASGSADDGALPFTGLDLGLALGGGLILLGTGVALSRLVARGSTA